MEHKCNACGATVNVLIMQLNEKGKYELRCDLHTVRNWKTVAAVNMTPVRVLGIGQHHRLEGA